MRSKKSETKKEMTAEEVADFRKTLMDVAAVLMPDMVDSTFDSFVSEVRPTDEAAPDADGEEDPYDQILSAIAIYSEKNKFKTAINAELLRREMEKRKGEKK